MKASPLTPLGRKKCKAEKDAKVENWWPVEKKTGFSLCVCGCILFIKAQWRQDGLSAVRVGWTDGQIGMNFSVHILTFPLGGDLLILTLQPFSVTFPPAPSFQFTLLVFKWACLLIYTLSANTSSPFGNKLYTTFFSILFVCREDCRG